MSTVLSSPPTAAQARQRDAAWLLRRLADPAGPAALLLAGLLALAFAYYLFGAAFMRGTASFWLQEDGDVAQYIAGFNAYVREPWHWPLLRLESINWPQGTLITFLDGIPLYALALKLLQHGSDLPFRNPYAAWIVLCYLLQGAGAWWICREAQLRSWIALAALTLLLASFPALTHRIHHISLMSQWLLLFAFALYLRGSRTGRLAGAGWALLLLAGFYINIYLFSMAAVVFGADLLRNMGRKGLGPVLPAMLGAPLLLLMTMLITMLPLGSGDGGEWGFGYYSMNLLAPLAGGNLLHFPHPTATPGQGEGFNYLGLFLLGFTVYGLRLRAQLDPTFWRRNRALLLSLAGLTLFALSSSVYLGQQLLYELALPRWTDTVTSQFRVSARFFWPVGYALMIFTVLSIQRYAGPRRAAALLVALVALQLWDLQPHHQTAHETANITSPVRLNQPLWNAFLGPKVDTLQAYPPFGCGKGEATQTVLPAMRYAVAHQIKISTGYVARVKKPCDNYAQEIAASTAPGAAFLFFKADFATMNQVEQLLGGAPAAECIEADFAWLCKRRPGMEKKP